LPEGKRPWKVSAIPDRSRIRRGIGPAAWILTRDHLANLFDEGFGKGNRLFRFAF